MSRLANSLSKQQMLLIENLDGSKQYGIARPSKGEIRGLKKLGLIKMLPAQHRLVGEVVQWLPQGFALTPEANDLITGKVEPKRWPRYRGDE